MYTPFSVLTPNLPFPACLGIWSWSSHIVPLPAAIRMQKGSCSSEDLVPVCTVEELSFRTLVALRHQIAVASQGSELSFQQFHRNASKPCCNRQLPCEYQQYSVEPCWGEEAIQYGVLLHHNSISLLLNHLKSCVL